MIIVNLVEDKHRRFVSTAQFAECLVDDLYLLFDFLNRRAFENWTTRTEADLRSQIVKFLDSIQGPTRLIEKFRVIRIEQDPNQKDRVLLDIHITPYFPAKSFVIQLEGRKGEEPEEANWESQYKQDK